jgi:hypothetical protein
MAKRPDPKSPVVRGEVLGREKPPEGDFVLRTPFECRRVSSREFEIPA